jgi:hypothetical protein
MTRTTAVTAACLALMSAAGCTSYYRVTDPTTGREYYTTDLDSKKSGAAKLKDAKTGNTVNLQNSEIAKVSKEEFESGKYAAPKTAAKPEPEPSPFSSSQ